MLVNVGLKKMQWNAQAIEGDWAGMKPVHGNTVNIKKSQRKATYTDLFTRVIGFGMFFEALVRRI
jgi:hypothetical protein